MIDLWESVIRTTSALAVVLVLMGLLAVVVRRFMGPRLGIAGGRPLIQVLASGYVAPRKTISLVEVAGEYLIVGATATDLVSLGRVSDSAHLHELLARTDQQSSTVTSSEPEAVFSSWLRRLPLNSVDHDKEHHGH